MAVFGSALEVEIAVICKAALVVMRWSLEDVRAGLTFIQGMSERRFISPSGLELLVVQMNPCHSVVR